MSSIKAYPSKILLLGEYTVTRGAPALAIPFFGKSGKWQKQENVCARLPELLSFFKENSFHDMLDLNTFEEDINHGWYFDSDIPSGYGLGSSGALIAAVYEKYVLQPETDIIKLRSLFSIMENHYHGKSSGIDPLVSYLRESVYMENEQKLNRVSLPPFMDVQIFLLDSFRTRNTEFWVNVFQNKNENSLHFSEAVNSLAVINQQAIEALLEGDHHFFWANIQKISLLQFEHFREFIPENHLTLWENSLKNEEVAFKLCGAGGGGYTLGFSKNMSVDYHKIMSYNPVWVE